MSLISTTHASYLRNLPHTLCHLLLAAVIAGGCSSESDSGKDVQDTSFLPDQAEDTAGPSDSSTSPELAASETVETATSDSTADTDVQTEEPFVCRAAIEERIVEDKRDETFDLGPFLMVPTPNSIIIKWRTLEETDGAVLYGLGETPDTEVLETAPATIHQVKLEGLKANTRYSYQVRSGGVTSQVHHFYTAPPEGGSFRFNAWGDNQGGETFPELVADMTADQPHILLGLGDHTSDGQVDELWKTQYLDIVRALLHEVPIFAAFGNHGYNGHLYYDLMAYEGISVSPKWESVYSYTYGNTFFLVIDTNGLFFPIGDVDSEWSAWIKQQMVSEAAKKATWRIAYAHEPGLVEGSQVESCEVSGYTTNKAVTAWLLPALEEAGFHLYMAGHIHWYERTWSGKLVQIISGGGGGGLDECVAPGTSSVMALKHHFLRGLVGCNTLRVEAVDLEGNVFDWVELEGGEQGKVVSEGKGE